MNIFIGVLSVILGTTLGTILSNKYVKRKKFFFDLKNFNNKFKAEVAFSQKSLKEIISLEQDSVFLNFLFNSIINNNKNLSISFLNASENEFIREYTLMIGGSDKYSQLSYLSSCDERINHFCKLAEDDEKRYRKLYIKLGFLFGLIILVVLL